MKKNILSWMTIVLMAFMCIGFSACGGDDDDNGGGSGGSGGQVRDANLIGTWCVYRDYGNDGILTFLVFDESGNLTQRAYEIGKSQGQLTWQAGGTKSFNYKLKGGGNIWISNYLGNGGDFDGTYTIKDGVLTLSMDGMSTSFDRVTGSIEEYLQSLRSQVTTYTYMLQTDELTTDNFTFFDYQFTWADGSTSQTGTILSPTATTSVKTESNSSSATVLLTITPKTNLESLVDAAKNYTLADWQGIKLLVKGSDGSVYQSSGKSNVVSNTGKYLLANTAYFTNTITFTFVNGSQINRTVATEQPALHDPDPDVTQGDAIDLGLSVKWASSNVVGDKTQFNTSSGSYSYFAWGETTCKADFTWNTYKFYNGRTFTKYYTTDGKTRLDAEDDAAHVYLGGNWRMPTKAEVQELVNNCTWTWTSYQGRSGYLVTGKNGNNIFLPANGHLEHNTIAFYGYPVNWNTWGSYWTSEILTTTGEYPYQSGAILGFNKNEITTNELNARYGGSSIRAVLPY